MKKENKKVIEELTNKELLEKYNITNEKYKKFSRMSTIGIILEIVSIFLPGILGILGFLVGIELVSIGAIIGAVYLFKNLKVLKEIKKREITESDLNYKNDTLDLETPKENVEIMETCPKSEEVFPEFEPNYDSNKENKTYSNKR